MNRNALKCTVLPILLALIGTGKPPILPPSRNRHAPEIATESPPRYFSARGVSGCRTVFQPATGRTVTFAGCRTRPNNSRRTSLIAASISGTGIFTAAATASNVMPENLSCPNIDDRGYLDRGMFRVRPIFRHELQHLPRPPLAVPPKFGLQLRRVRR